MMFLWAFLFFLAFNAIVIGVFLWLLRKWHGKPLEFGYSQSDTNQPEEN